MFEENLGLYTATPCLESVGSASCSNFPSIFPLGVSLLSVLSCFLRQEPVCRQSQGVDGTSGAGFLAAADPRMGPGLLHY